MAEVNVSLGERSYPIYIDSGNLCQIGSLMQQRQWHGKVFVVSDDNVGALYGEPVLAALRAAGYQADLFCIPAGEASKSLLMADRLYTQAITLGLDRKSVILALGGGVVGDLTGFIAATYLRGVDFVQIPTSLLAQVDSSVGGKVAVNHALGKNLIGAFYQPKLVLIDTDVLSTLPERELSTGLAEVVKHGMIDEPAFFSYLAANVAAILAKQPEALSEIIRRSCVFKAKVVEQDEQEAGLRMILNFGHTMAHAIEADTGYSRYNHGEAVAVGMCGAAVLSQSMGLCQPSVVAELQRLLTCFHLPLSAPECRADDLWPYFSRDKKTVDGQTQWILLSGIGRAAVHSDVPQAAVYQALKEISQ